MPSPTPRIPEDHPAVEAWAKRKWEQRAAYEEAKDRSHTHWIHVQKAVQVEALEEAHEDLNDLWPLLCGELEEERPQCDGSGEIRFKLDGEWELGPCPGCRYCKGKQRKRAEKAEEELEQLKVEYDEATQELATELIDSRKAEEIGDRTLAEVRAEVERRIAQAREDGKLERAAHGCNIEQRSFQQAYEGVLKLLDSAPSVSGDGKERGENRGAGEALEALASVLGWLRLKGDPEEAEETNLEVVLDRLRRVVEGEDYIERWEAFKAKAGEGAVHWDPPKPAALPPNSTRQLPDKSLSREPGDREDEIPAEAIKAGKRALQEAGAPWPGLWSRAVLFAAYPAIRAALTQQSADPEVGERKDGVGVGAGTEPVGRPGETPGATAEPRASVDSGGGGTGSENTGLSGSHTPAAPSLTQPEADPEVPRCGGSGR
jgi:hypothetical protein